MPIESPLPYVSWVRPMIQLIENLYTLAWTLGLVGRLKVPHLFDLFNDYVQVLIQDSLSASLWVTQEVKQGEGVQAAATKNVMQLQIMSQNWIVSKLFP